MKRFWLWLPEHGEKEEDGREVKPAYDWQRINEASDAAESYFEQRHSDFDYATELHVSMRAMNDSGDPFGATLSFRVDAEPTVEFHAEELTP